MHKINRQLEERMQDFGVAVIKYCDTVPARNMQKIIDQLIRSGNSIGANFVEANNACSKADFRNKIYTAKKRQQKLFTGLVFFIKQVTVRPNLTYCVMKLKFLS